MDTPIIDFVKRYYESGTLRFHMPGHKGVKRLGCEMLDITEITGADSLYEAAGIIYESERNASELFGFGHTFYSTEGSSLCIKAMLYLIMQHGLERRIAGRRIIAGRNVHKSFINACALLDLLPEWIYPDGNEGSLWSCRIDEKTVAKMLKKSETPPLALYLTAPDYLGYSPDIKAISEVCRQYDVPLIVDNAHGAYLKFLKDLRHPIDLGAFMSCDSAHKTLPVLTGGAYLQLSDKVPEKLALKAKNALSIFGSSSPSYLILQSLDLCNRYLFEGYRDKLTQFIAIIDEAKQKLQRLGWEIDDSDPLRIVINTLNRGYRGEHFAGLLRQAGIECEFADKEAVVFMLTPDNKKNELDYLLESLEGIPCKPPLSAGAVFLPRGVRAMSVREAMLSPSEIIPVSEAQGRICAAPTISCPPAVPIAVSGEVITGDVLKLLDQYGIKNISVVVSG